MIKLYGIKRAIYQEKIGGDFKVDELKELVATFSGEFELNEFLNSRLLATPEPFEGFHAGRKFKQVSDMGMYNDFEVVEEPDEPEIPHDPC